MDSSALQQYFDLYNLNYSAEHKKFEKVLLDDADRQIYIWHPRGFVFFYFQKFLKKEISLEEFFAIGDISNEKYPLVGYEGSHDSSLTAGEKAYREMLADPSRYKDAIFLRESTLYQYFCSHNPDAKEQFQNLCDQYNIEFIACS